MIAPWLQAHLEATGAWDNDGISRHAKSRRCSSCGMWVLAGLDDPRCAGPAVVDTEPLNALGEAVALLTGRTTYTLARRGNHIELDHRNPWAIAANNPEGDVVAEHTCRTTTPPLQLAPTRLRPPTRRQELADDPPY
jgi:hypothetical protein